MSARILRLRSIERGDQVAALVPLASNDQERLRARRVERHPARRRHQREEFLLMVVPINHAPVWEARI